MIHFITSSLAEALVAGCDCVQIKYDGIFAQFCTANGRFSIITQENRGETLEGVNPDVICTLIGAFVPHARKFFVHDCWCIEEPPSNIIDLRRQPYRSRYVAARIQIKLLGGPFELVQNLPIAASQSLWANLKNVPFAKGIVFRNSQDLVGTQLRCARWYAELPGELI